MKQEMRLILKSCYKKMPNGHNETIEEFLIRRENEGSDKGALCPHCGLAGTMREMVEHHDVCPALQEEDKDEGR